MYSMYSKILVLILVLILEIIPSLSKMAEPEIVVYDPAKHHHLLPALVELHVRCIQFDKALLRFHPPFTASQRERMLSFWEERHEQAALNRMTIILSLANVETSVEIAGVVELATPEADTGPFRADIEMLMVSPDYRRGGIGKQLMNALEGIAIARDRTLLVCYHDGLSLGNIDTHKC